jgi:hypothetical protein
MLSNNPSTNGNADAHGYRIKQWRFMGALSTGPFDQGTGRVHLDRPYASLIGMDIVSHPHDL